MPFNFRSPFSTTLAVTCVSVAFAAVTAAGTAHAQHRHGAAPTAAPALVSSSVVTAAVRPFRSIMDGYRRFDADTPLTDWRKANDTVREIGGWQAYAKQSAAEIAKEKSRTTDGAALPKRPEK